MPTAIPQAIDQQYYNIVMREHQYASRLGMVLRGSGVRFYLVKPDPGYKKPYQRRLVNRPVKVVNSPVQSYIVDTVRYFCLPIISDGHRTGIFITRKIKTIRRYLSYEQPWR